MTTKNKMTTRATNHINEILVLMYAFFIYIFNYTGISHEGLFILSILMLIDTILGWIKVASTGGKPSSKELKKGFIGKVVVLIIPFVLALLFKSVGREGDTIISTALGLFTWSEGYSIIRNSLVIKTGKHIEEYDAITEIIKYLLDIVKTGIETLMFKK